MKHNFHFMKLGKNFVFERKTKFRKKCANSKGKSLSNNKTLILLILKSLTSGDFYHFDKSP